MDFELPLTDKITEEKVAFQLEEDPVEKTTSKISQEFDDASLEMKFELKDESTTLSEESLIGVQEAEMQVEDSKTNPFEQSIDQTIASQSQKRREHLKAFNHKFKHQVQRVDEMEREPAYKRQGMDLDAEEPNTPSRFSLDDDGNDDLQLRSNNSFLHDNVD
jgi:cell division protein FtsZ